MAFYPHSYEMPTVFHHVEPATLMPYQFENSDWMSTRESMDNNTATSWEGYGYHFSEEFYPQEESQETVTEYRSSSDPADMSPSSDGESDAVWSPSTSKSSSLLPTPTKEEPTNPIDCLSTAFATSAERSTSPEQASTTSTSTTAVSKKRESTVLNGSRKSASTSADLTDINAMKRKKAAHNAIEKRYRTNMNAKFVALGNAIPTFRHRQGLNGSGKNSSKKSLAVKDGSATSGTQPLPQNKSEVLTNALVYIRELQEQNRMLQSELTILKGNLIAPAAPMWRPVGMP